MAPDIEYDLDVDNDIVGDDWVAIKAVRLPGEYMWPYEERFTQPEWDEYFKYGTGNLSASFSYYEKTVCRSWLQFSKKQDTQQKW